MAITFNAEWASGLDGASYVPPRVKQIMDSLESIQGQRVGDSIDHVLAVCCENSESVEDMVDHLNYIIKQLNLVKHNVKVELLQKQKG